MQRYITAVTRFIFNDVDCGDIVNSDIILAAFGADMFLFAIRTQNFDCLIRPTTLFVFNIGELNNRLDQSAG